MPDEDITRDLFRFLQLLCEGHNSGYLLDAVPSYTLFTSFTEVYNIKERMFILVCIVVFK